MSAMEKDLKPTIRILETTQDLQAVQEITSLVWGKDDVVPIHLLVTVAHNGGLIIGAFIKELLGGFVFGFPGLISTSERLQVKHCSHMMAVRPELQNQGVGYALKRAQWQMVRRQGLELITWTYDPLLSKNGYLNIARLGAVCSTYFRDHYGEMIDRQNIGVPSDRFQVELWVNSTRVRDKMSKRPRRQLDLAHYHSAGASIINPTHLDDEGLPRPPDSDWTPERISEVLDQNSRPDTKQPSLFLLEIPTNFKQLKAVDQELAVVWRKQTRALFEDLFSRGYIVTDSVYLRGTHPRSFYVLSHGESTLGG